MDLYELYDTEKEDCLDIAILSKLDLLGLAYFDECCLRYNKEIEKDNTLIASDIMNDFRSYFAMYLRLYVSDNMAKFVDHITTNLESQLWDIYITENTDLINILQQISEKVKPAQNKFTILRKLFDKIHKSTNLMNEFIKWHDEDGYPNDEYDENGTKIDSIISFTGVEYEQKSLLSLFYIINVANNTQIKQMLELFEYLYNNDAPNDKKELLQVLILQLLHRAIDSNIYCAHINIDYDTLNKCSSPNFIATLMFICFKLYKSEQQFTLETTKINEDKQDRTSFEIYGEDNIQTILFYVVNYCIYVCFTPLFGTKDELKRQIRQIQSYGLFFGPSYQSKHTIKLENELNIIDELITHPQINNVIMELYENMSEIVEHNKESTILTESILYSIYNFFNNMLFELKISQFDNIIYKFFENICNGKYFQNPHVRFQCSSLLFNMDRTENNTTENTFMSLMKYYVDVDYPNWTQYTVSHKHTVSFLKSFLSVLQILNYNFDFKNDTTRLFVYKLCTGGLSDCGTMNTYIDEAQKILVKHKIAEKSHGYDKLIASIVKHTGIIVTKLINETSLLSYIIANCDFLIIPPEILSHLIVFVVNAIQLYNNDIVKLINNEDKQYEKMLDHILSFHLEKPCIVETLDQINKINIGPNNQIKILFEKSEKIKELLEQHKLKLEKQKHIVYPEEFLDPIMYTKIIDPIMIPDVTTVLDKSSIITHLYTSKTNPFTQQPLTEEEINEYNKKQEIVDKIREFREKLFHFENNV